VQILSPLLGSAGQRGWAVEPVILASRGKIAAGAGPGQVTTLPRCESVHSRLQRPATFAPPPACVRRPLQLLSGAAARTDAPRAQRRARQVGGAHSSKRCDRQRLSAALHAVFGRPASGEGDSATPASQCRPAPSDGARARPGAASACCDKCDGAPTRPLDTIFLNSEVTLLHLSYRKVRYVCTTTLPVLGCWNLLLFAIPR
jgi:hypothetical protein